MPSFLACLFEGTRHRKAAARVGHEDIYRPDLLFYLTAHSFDLGEPGDVAENLHRRPAIALDIGLHSAQCRRIPAVHCYLCALLRKQPGDRGSNAARTARNQGDFVFQEIHTLLLNYEKQLRHQHRSVA